MIAYEFYWLDPIKEYELLGVLPERRKNSERITRKSVMGWAQKIFGENTVRIFRPIPFTINQKGV
jgi:hypothetical protein